MRNDPLAGSGLSIPGVLLEEVLGAGAFGQVHRGRHRTLDIDVAVELIGLASVAPSDHGRLLQEAQLMARLDHPNLLRVFPGPSTACPPAPTRPVASWCHATPLRKR
jgi:serine/threonine protein kinase